MAREPELWKGSDCQEPKKVLVRTHYGSGGGLELHLQLRHVGRRVGAGGLSVHPGGQEAGGVPMEAQGARAEAGPLGASPQSLA